MKKIHIDSSYVDSRGSITDIVTRESIDAVTLITFARGAVRANHYHKETTQWNYLLSGALDAGVRYSDGMTEITPLVPGDLIVSSPGEAHAFRCNEDAVLLVFTQGPRAGTEYESDTFRLDTPIFE